MSARELGLTLPLHGVQLIEASAGTGKTHALATLYTRLVIEARLAVGEILAVTYTRAATAELRERLRLRLREALQCAQQEPVSIAASTLELVQAAIAREGRPALQRRLRHAVAAMDAAPIHTIHGFCQRALADFALEAGQALLPRELLANERELRLEVATEFWREVSRQPQGARTLDALASGPSRLAAMLRDLLAYDALEPAAPPVDVGMAGGSDEAAGNDAALEHARACLAQAWAAHAETARALLHGAWETRAVNRQRSDDEKVDAVWVGLAEWAAADGDDDRLHRNTWWYGSAELRGKAGKGKEAQVPSSPLFEAIECWHAASVAALAQRLRDRIALLHRLRDFARVRLARLKRERGVIGYDDLIGEVATALEGASGDAFAARLQAQYRVALLDEFQDTDPRQSAIFTRLFATGVELASEPEPDADATSDVTRAMFLIGDPKQAIYRFRGGDVVAYLIAAHRADQRHALAQNFRSRPRALAAVEALFQRAGPQAFAHDDIVFHAVESGGECQDEDFSCDGAPAPALTVLTLDDIDTKTPIEDVRVAAAQACAAAILALLRAGADGRAMRRRKGAAPGPVVPGDIAVLVEKNDDTVLVRSALSALGIPSVASGRESVFATEEAEDLRRLLQTLRAPGDEARLRAALATTLIGLDAAALDALDADEAAQRHWQERILAWRQRAERAGPLAVVNALCAEQAARLLRLPAGERRLANYLQLGEALQDLAQAAPGLDALLDAYERRIEAADSDNEDELLRLESDADRVSVLTLHKSKGLEFEFVFLPLIATHGATRQGASPFARYHDGEQRVLHLLGFDTDQEQELKRLERHEERAERLRLLYVGLTRARLATWIVWGTAKQVEYTALAWLLHRPPQRDTVPTLDRAGLAADLEDWRRAAPTAIDIRPAETAPTAARFVASTPTSTPPARRAQHELSRDWWVYSYSLLAREQRGQIDVDGDEHRAQDEVGTSTLPEEERSRLVGARFGNSLHAALERVDAARWRDWHADEPPAADAAILDEALRAEGYIGDADLAEGRPLLTRLIRNTLNQRLPEGVRLCNLEPGAMRHELEFHLSLAPTAIPALLQVLHAHGIVPERQAFGLRRRIEGLLTGRIDLVYRHDGRYYVLDYKSNRLGDYSREALADAVRDSEYDLQYVLYTLALHRWLRFRIGAAYDYVDHIGGVRYLFCRGLDAARDDDAGVHALCPPRALIDALDALFAGRSMAAA